MDPSALGLTGELAEPFCAFPSVKSIFGWQPHTFYELLREMALEPEPTPFSKPWAEHFGNSLKVRLLHQSQPQAHRAKPSAEMLKASGFEESLGQNSAVIIVINEPGHSHRAGEGSALVLRSRAALQ